MKFIMEHEQMTYPEALKWLANKYHIEVHERELSTEEKQQESERESMFLGQRMGLQSTLRISSTTMLWYGDRNAILSQSWFPG